MYYTKEIQTDILAEEVSPTAPAAESAQQDVLPSKKVEQKVDQATAAEKEGEESQEDDALRPTQVIGKFHFFLFTVR